jgi:hypothetical protein
VRVSTMIGVGDFLSLTTASAEESGGWCSLRSARGPPLARGTLPRVVTDGEIGEDAALQFTTEHDGTVPFQQLSPPATAAVQYEIAAPWGRETI